MSSTRSPTSDQRATVVAGFLGWTLDAFDFFLVVMTLTAIAKEFGKSDKDIALSITLTLAFRPVGAFIFGLLADRYGRKLPLMIDLVFYSVIEVLTGFAPNYTTFLVLRALFGIGMGAEWGVGGSLVMAKVSPRYRGIVSGLLQQGYALGFLLAALCYRSLSPLFGWRPLFFIGGLPALLALFVRARVKESEVWRETRHESWSGLGNAILANLPLFAYITVLMWMMNMVSHGTQDMYPTFLQRHWGFSAQQRGDITIVSMIGALGGGITFGLYSDRLGRRRAIGLALCAAVVVIPLWAFAPSRRGVALGRGSSYPKAPMTTFVKAPQAYQHGQRTLPGRYYNAPEIWAEERERIFARRWICVGRAAELGQPGDYAVRAVGGESVMVVRGQDGAVRAFYNVCRHRGTRLCETERGRLSETIQCPYHAWTYTLDGTLIGAPHMNEVAGFDKRDYPLHQVALAEWEGFLFINLAQEPEPFARAFAPLAGRFSRFNIAKLRSGARIEYDVHANWKLVFQNYSECLHCPIIHPGLAKLTPYTSGENDLFDGPYLGGYMVITAPGGSLTMSGRACGPAVGDFPVEDQNRVYFYTIFPNLLLSLHPDYVMFHTLWPQAPDRTHITCEWLFHPDAFGQPGFDPDDAVRFWDETNRQDWHICEQSHAGIASRAYQPGPYSPREGIAAAWDREFLRAIGHAHPQ